MSKTKVHVLIPHSLYSACGIHMPYKNTATRNGVTCPKCKSTDYYKQLKRV